MIKKLLNLITDFLLLPLKLFKKLFKIKDPKLSEIDRIIELHDYYISESVDSELYISDKEYYLKVKYKG